MVSRIIDATGRFILATTLVCLLAGIGAHAAMERDLERNGGPRPHFSHSVLVRIVGESEEAARRGSERNLQAIIERGFQSELRVLLLAERFVRAATGLVIILGLLGTFYGLTLSIGRLVHLVAADTGAVADVTQGITRGLTDALTGMAVAFSNSLVGILSAVVLTVLGVVSNVTDRRTALMIELETYLDRLVQPSTEARGDTAASVAAFGGSVARLDAVVARFEAALQRFARDTKDLREVHLVVALKPGDER